MKKLLATILFAAVTAHAVEMGHFNGGVMDIRDYFVPPDPGFYGLVYNYYYFTDRLNNGNGDKIQSLSVGGVPVNVGVNVDFYGLMPVLVWAAPCTILGAKYAAYIAPSFANNSLEAQLSIADTAGGSVQNSSFGVGDLYVQPLWLDWAKSHWDLMLAYGFYAPVGKYDTQTIPLPSGADVTVESPGNIGLGYWTQQAQGGIAWYPMTNRATAVTAVMTYEYNSRKKDLDVRPGQMITLNWGISQYLPLRKDQHLLLDVGPAGYDGWQITDNTGGAGIDSGSLSRVHGVGGQLGLIIVPLKATVTFHGFYEYAAESRFQGASIGLNFGIKF